MNNQPQNSGLTESTTPPPGAVQNAQPAAENPLDKLRDIHLPEPIDAFPYAPGWWILLGILLVIIGYFVYRRIQYYRAIRLLKPAKQELAQLASLTSNEINAASIARLSALLKRVCLLYFDRHQIASLNGARWVEFLNQQMTRFNQNSNASNQPLFSDKDSQLFAQAAYQKSTTVEQTQWSKLLKTSEACIETIIKSSAKTQLAIFRKASPNHCSEAK